MNVLVTGASGQTGVLVFQKLNERRSEFNPRGLIRNKKAIDAIGHKLGKTVQSQLVVCDVRKPSPALTSAFVGVHSVIICTSAQPTTAILSLPGAGLKKLLGKEAHRDYYFPEGEDPEAVDWIGTKNQIDLAKAAGVKHVILVGAMGGTRPEHPMNTVGGGNMLLWKRKAERYLIQAGMEYTILHCGQLLPVTHKEQAPGGQRELVVAVDDQLVDWPGKNTIPREDVAEVCVKALISKAARNRAFDLGSLPPGEGVTWDGDLEKLLKGLNGANCKYAEPEWP